MNDNSNPTQEEVWLPIKNFENLYTISNLGRVKSVVRNRIRSYSMARDYRSVTLYNQNASKTFKIHRLVAEAFIPNPHNKPTVNHINGKKLDNRLSNLEWATDSENSIHAFKMGLRKAPCPNQKGVKMSEEIRRRMSESRRKQIRKPCSEEAKKKISQTLLRRSQLLKSSKQEI